MKANQKHIIITGGSSGIGAAMVELLLKQQYTISNIDIQQPLNENIVSQYKTEYSSYACDVRNHDLLQSTIQNITTTHPVIYGYVHCAGIYPSVRFPEHTIEIWNDCFAVNVTPAFVLAKLITPHMTHNDGGSIVHITSGAVHLGSRDPGYSASKSALEGLTKSLAKNLASSKIRVNNVSPGPIDTPMSRKGMRTQDVEEYKHTILLKRFGEPSEIAEAVSFLLSENSTFITGTTIHINGGLYCS